MERAEERHEEYEEKHEEMDNLHEIEELNERSRSGMRPISGI